MSSGRVTTAPAGGRSVGSASEAHSARSAGGAGEAVGSGGADGRPSETPLVLSLPPVRTLSVLASDIYFYLKIYI